MTIQPNNTAGDPFNGAASSASTRMLAPVPAPSSNIGGGDDAIVRPLKMFLSMIWKWKLLIVSLPILFSVLGMLYSLSVQKTWRSEAKLQLKSGSSNFNPFDPYSVPYYDHLRWLETQKLILTTDRVLKGVYDNVKTFDDFVSPVPGDVLPRDEVINIIRGSQIGRASCRERV